MCESGIVSVNSVDDPVGGLVLDELVDTDPTGVCDLCVTGVEILRAVLVPFDKTVVDARLTTLVVLPE